MCENLRASDRQQGALCRSLMRFRLSFVWLTGLALGGACAGHGTKPGATAASDTNDSIPAAGATAAPNTGGVVTEDAGVVPAEPPAGASLPEVRVESVGMHIGGMPNDPASKEPFARALTKQFPELRGCYRLLEEPKSGTFGVDLHIPRGGGKPRVEQPRTALRGDAFRDCVVRAFQNTEFEKTKLPIVISYSVKFSVGQ